MRKNGSYLSMENLDMGEDDHHSEDESDDISLEE